MTFTNSDHVESHIAQIKRIEDDLNSKNALIELSSMLIDFFSYDDLFNDESLIDERVCGLGDYVDQLLQDVTCQRELLIKYPKIVLTLKAIYARFMHKDLREKHIKMLIEMFN